MSSQEKAADAFRTISEVAEELDLPQHVLRFWETRFSQIKPLKRGGGRRYYRPDDVELLCGIRHLLYGEGYTIKGVQRILKEQGPRFVMQIWREDAVAVPVGHQMSANVVFTPDQPEASEEALQPKATPQSDAMQAAPEGPVEVAEPDVLPGGLIAEDAPGSIKETPTRSSFIGRLRGEKVAGPQQVAARSLSQEEVKSLQSTMFDLLECKRLLDQVR
ncbi:MerR family transcriptional regulator [Roseibium sp.]|uniref:MerR family transcriptional regulator n=1 Tax=Roseibium sp. TaxID=1936156 RepID=UPI003A983579